MKKIDPYLFVRELRVYSGTTLAYEATFHTGVNIIRGKNSSGKSTVMSLLFYGLGGEYTRWVAEVLKCNAVYVEVEINGAVFSLRREIKGSAPQPLDIYWGPLTDGLTSAVGWQEYPLRRTENKESFSQVLFRALSFPEVKTEDESNITMHQVLRLLFADQLSNPFSLMIDEKFDSPLTRKATGNLLLGVFDNDLYNAQLNLKKTRRELDAQESQYKALVSILRDSEQFSTVVQVKHKLDELAQETEQINAQITTATVVQSRKQADTRLAELMKVVADSRNALGTAAQELQKLDFDISDSKEFVETLQNRIVALTESIDTRQLLGQLPISQCPHCLTSLAREHQENHCVLCAQPLPPEAEQTQAMRMRQELEYQLRESEKLLVLKVDKAEKIQAKMPELKSNLRVVQKNYDKFLETAQSTRDENIDQLLVKKGNLEKEIQFLQRQLAAMGVLENLRLKVVELKQQVSELTDLVDTKSKAQGKKAEVAYSSISRLAVSLLKKDGNYETAFANAQQVEVNFDKNTFYVDGRANFSASSVTYLKNSALYAIFFASLENEFFRYPRLIMCDNMEDKGMQEQRSKTLQKSIVELSGKFGVAHQIIFSTSMIEETLNNDKYCIGEFYGPTNKTLKL
jgi:hypothetical protein